SESRCFQLSAISYQLSAISYQPSAIRFSHYGRGAGVGRGLGVEKGLAVAVGVAVAVDVAVGVSVAVGVGVGVAVPHGTLINCSFTSNPVMSLSDPPGATMRSSPTAVPYKTPRLTFMSGPRLQVSV